MIVAILHSIIENILMREATINDASTTYTQSRPVYFANWDG